jgi:hypothetical protein
MLAWLAIEEPGDNWKEESYNNSSAGAMILVFSFNVEECVFDYLNGIMFFLTFSGRFSGWELPLSWLQEGIPRTGKLCFTYTTYGPGCVLTSPHEVLF